MEIIEVKNKVDGAKAAFDLLKKTVDKESAVFLSGGSSPEDLYKLIAQDKKRQVNPLAFCTIDERWGPPDHQNSNELMIKQTGLYDYAHSAGIEVHKILQGILNRHETAQRYAVVIDGIFARTRNSVAIMGIGADGHTAGIAPGAKFDKDKQVLDYSYSDANWQYPERITLTPKSLMRIDEHIVLAFGGEKLPALKKLIAGENKIYGQIHNMILITDQNLSKVPPFTS